MVTKFLNIRFSIFFLIGVSVSFLSSAQSEKFHLNESITRGKDLYIMHCMSCHMENGEGLEGAFPPVAKSDYLMADKNRSITEILNGLSGEITVNGKVYYGDMPAFDLTDKEVSDVLNYVRNSWGNKGKAVIPAEVKALR